MGKLTGGRRCRFCLCKGRGREGSCLPRDDIILREVGRGGIIPMRRMVASYMPVCASYMPVQASYMPIQAPYMPVCASYPHICPCGHHMCPHKPHKIGRAHV